MASAAVVACDCEAPPVSDITISISAPPPHATTPPGGAAGSTPKPRTPSVSSPARTTHSVPSDTDSSNGDPSISAPHQRPAPAAEEAAAPGNEYRQLQLVLLGFSSAELIGVIPELGRIGGWNTAAQVAYGVFTMVAAALLPIAFMAGFSNHPSVSAFCAKLGAIVCSDLLLVAISTRFGRWGCLAAAPSAAVLTCIMAALWIWGNKLAAVANYVSECWGRVVMVLLAPPPEHGDGLTEIEIAGRRLPITDEASGDSTSFGGGDSSSSS